jgi:hypothetical protein
VKTINYCYLEDEQRWLGNLPDYPDYWEEGESFESLHSNLSHLDFDLTVFNVLKDKKAARPSLKWNYNFNTRFITFSLVIASVSENACRL